MPDFPIGLPISVRSQGSEQAIGKISAAMERLTKHTTKLSGAFQNAFQFYVRFRIFGLINRGISTIEGAIPGLIARSREWARTVDEVADATGLAAGQASVFAGVAQVMTGNVEGLTRALGALAQQTANHGDVLKRYGIQTKDANGALLDTWTILGNVRKALSDTGNGFITTAAARDLFSRGGQTLLDMLTMTDKAFRMVVRDVQASGAVMSEQGLRVADQWERTTNRLQVQITGVANLLMEAIGPNLMRFTDAITNFIRANLEQIVSFLAKVVSAVVNFAAGFLGLDLSMEAFAEGVDKANKGAGNLQGRLDRLAKSRQDQAKRESAHTDAIKANIAAIDRQLAALSRQDRAENARAEQKRLLAEITEAKRDLNELRGKAIFAAGMSNREAELARQAQAGDIMEAQKKIADARKRLAEHNRKVALDERRYELEQRKAALQEQLNAQMKAMADRHAADREAMQQLGQGGQQFKGLEKVIRSAKGAWAEVGPDFKTAGENFRVALSGIGDNLLGLWESLKVELPKWIAAVQEGARLLDKIVTGIGELLGKVFGDDGGGQKIPGVSLSPAEWAGAAAAAFFTKGIWGPALTRIASSLFGSASAAVGGSAVGAAVGGAASSAAGRVGMLASFLRSASILSLIASATSAAIGIISPPAGMGETLGRIGRKDTPSNRQFVKNTGIDSVFGIQKSVQDGLHTLFGTGPGTVSDQIYNAVVGEASAASSGASSTLATVGANTATVAARLPLSPDYWSQSVASQQATAANVAAVGAKLPEQEMWTNLRASQQVAANYLFANGRSAAQHLAVIGQYLQRVAYPRPGHLWGQATINLYMDKELLMTMAGVPIAQGNSSLRPGRYS